jgi:hypothetical protein
MTELKDIKPGHPIWEEVWEKSGAGPGRVSHLDQLFAAKIRIQELELEVAELRSELAASYNSD